MKSSILCTVYERFPTDTVSFRTTEFNTVVVLICLLEGSVVIRRGGVTVGRRHIMALN